MEDRLFTIDKTFGYDIGFSFFYALQLFIDKLYIGDFKVEDIFGDIFGNGLDRLFGADLFLLGYYSINVELVDW